MAPYDGEEHGRAGPPGALSDATQRASSISKRGEEERSRGPTATGPGTATAARALPPPGGGRGRRGAFSACTRASGAAPAERCNDGLNTGRAGPPRSLSDATPRCLIDQRRTEAPRPRGPRTTTAARALPPPGGGRPTRGSACERPRATSARCSDGLNTGRAGPPRSLSDVPKDSLGRPLACGPAPVRVDTDVPPPATRPGRGFPSAKSAGPGESPDTLDCPRSSSVRVPVAATGHRSLPNQRRAACPRQKKRQAEQPQAGGGGPVGKSR